MEILAEIVLQLLFEVLAEFGLRAIKAPLQAPLQPAHEASPWMAGLGYVIYGTVVGGISLWFFPAAWLQAVAV